MNNTCKSVVYQFHKYNELFRNHTTDKGIQLAQAAGMPYDRLFNFQELVKKLAKSAHRGNLPNTKLCTELETQYVTVSLTKYRTACFC